MVWHKAMTDNDWANEFLNQSICFTSFTRGQVSRNNMRDWGRGGLVIGQYGIKQVVRNIIKEREKLTKKSIALDLLGIAPDLCAVKKKFKT